MNTPAQEAVEHALGRVVPPERADLIFDIARVCHEANKAYCWAIGDFSQVTWETAPGWQRDSAIKGVALHLDNPGLPPSASHDAWMAEKLRDGWVYGEKKDYERKTHPCIVPFSDLPRTQQLKDVLFIAIVKALADSPTGSESRPSAARSARMAMDTLLLTDATMKERVEAAKALAEAWGWTWPPYDAAWEEND